MINRTVSSVAVVVIGLIAALGGTWTYLHSKAHSKPIKTPFEHAFLKRAHVDGRPILFMRTAEPAGALKTSKAPESGKTPNFNLGIWLDVRLSGDGSLLVSREELFSRGIAKGKPIELATKPEWESAGLNEIATFSSEIQKYPTVLNLIARRPGLAPRLLDIWGPMKSIALENVVIQSESDGILKELRESQAQGLYGTSQATLIQIEMLANLGLAGLIEMKSDVIISTTEEVTGHGKKHPRLRDSTLFEAHRRGLRRYAGPTSSAETAREMLAAGYDGVLIESQETLESLVR